MRRILLWMAGNTWLRRNLPRVWFAKRAVRRFMPGEDAESALDAGERFAKDGIPILLTRLGENVTDRADAEATLAHYLDVFSMIEAREVDAEISVKLTQLGFDLDVEETFERVEALVVRAGQLGGMFWIDMEASPYADSTIAFYERLKARHPNVGLCLQSYLHRTAADIQRLLPLEPGIRLVKGAYAEPATIAYQDKREVDANYTATAVIMLQAAAAGRKVRIGLGTHDVKLIEQIAEHARALGLDRTAFEVQMLYGIREDEQRRLAKAGYPVRDLIAYGPAWYSWYMRRLAERPANVLFALRQAIG